MSAGFPESLNPTSVTMADTESDRLFTASPMMETEPDRSVRSEKLKEWMTEHNAEEMKIDWLEENAEKYGFIFRRKHS